MKRVRLLLLCFTMIFGTIVIPVFAASTDAYPFKPSGASNDSVPELEAIASTPDTAKNIAVGLSSSSYSGNLDTESKVTDVANHYSYGISIIGAKWLEGPASRTVDGIWASGSALKLTPDGNYYNYLGESNAVGGDGYLYTAIITLNFGMRMNMDAIGFVTGTGGAMGYPASADIYVSDTGADDDWKLVGYYDRAARLIETKADYAFSSSSVLGNDINGASVSDKKFIQFALPEGTTGTYLRIAVSAIQGKQAAYTDDSRASYAESITTSGGFRELLVFGEAENVNYVGHQTRTYTDTMDTDTTEDDVSYYDVRFSANVDDYTRYDAIGFQIEAVFEKGAYAETGKTYSKACRYVYTSLLAQDEEGNEITVFASEYHAGQLASLTIEGIPTDTGVAVFTVTPYYTITDADTGESKTIEAASYAVTFDGGVYQSTALVPPAAEG